MKKLKKKPFAVVDARTHDHVVHSWPFCVLLTYLLELPLGMPVESGTSDIRTKTHTDKSPQG